MEWRRGRLARKHCPPDTWAVMAWLSGGFSRFTFDFRRKTSGATNDVEVHADCLLQKTMCCRKNHYLICRRFRLRESRLNNNDLGFDFFEPAYLHEFVQIRALPG